MKNMAKFIILISLLLFTGACFICCRHERNISMSTIKPSGQLKEGWYMHFVNSQDGVVYGENLIVYITRNGGESWECKKLLDGFRFNIYSTPYVDIDIIYSFIYEVKSGDYYLLKFNVSEGSYSILNCGYKNPGVIWKQMDYINIGFMGKNNEHIVLKLDETMKIIYRSKHNSPCFSQNPICIDDALFYRSNQNFIVSDSEGFRQFEMHNPSCIKQISESTIIIIDSDYQTKTLIAYRYDVNKKTLEKTSELSGYESMSDLFYAEGILVGFVSEHIYHDVMIFSLDGGCNWNEIGRQTFYRCKSMVGNKLLINGGYKIKKFDFSL